MAAVLIVLNINSFFCNKCAFRSIILFEDFQPVEFSSDCLFIYLFFFSFIFVSDNIIFGKWISPCFVPCNGHFGFFPQCLFYSNN